MGIKPPKGVILYGPPGKHYFTAQKIHGHHHLNKITLNLIARISAKLYSLCCYFTIVNILGTGKTLLAKAVANQTSATFLRVVGSELIQKYLGDGPKLVRELFRVAEEHSPSIVFIDEIDAVGTKRYDSNSGGEREIQRTMLELLNQLDGFDGR